MRINPNFHIWIFKQFLLHISGIVVDNKEVSQPVITTDGVISHIASVLSGGSAINMAIVIQETDEYFDYLDSFPGVSFDRAKIKEVSYYPTVPIRVSQSYCPNFYPAENQE